MALKLSPFRVLLLAGASAVAVSTAAHAAPRVLFASGSGVAQGPLAPGQQIASQAGVTQVQLDSGAVISFVGPANFSIGADGVLQVQSGNVTLGGGTGPSLIRLANGGNLNISAGAAASFAITSAGTMAGQVMTGSATLATGGVSQTFTSAQFFNAQNGGSPTQTFAGLAPQATPGLGGGGVNIGGYDAILDAAIQQNPALTNLPLGQSQSQLASYLVALGQTIGQLYTPAQLLQLAQQYGPQTPTPTPTTPTPTPTTPTPTPTTPTPTPTTPTPTPTTPTPTPTTPTPTPTTPTPTPTTPTPTPTTPTPTPTTPTPTPTTPTPTPTTPTPTPANAAGLVEGQSYATVAMGRNAAGDTMGTGDAGSRVIGLDASGNPKSFGVVNVTTAALAEVSSAAGWTIGRYSGGVIERTSGTPSSVTFNANNGMNFAVVAPITGAMPSSGIAIYDSISTTTPVLYNGATAPGGSFSAKLGIGLGTTRTLGFEGVLTLPDGANNTLYNFSTAGGAAAPGVGLVYGSGEAVFYDGRAAVTTTGPLCGSSGCLMFMRGGFGGADGGLAAGIWEMFDVASSVSPVGGAVAFSRTAVTPTPTPTTPTPTPTTVTGTERSGQVVVYAGDGPGIDTRAGVTTTADASGQINRYVWTANESPERGSNAAYEVGKDGSGDTIIWTRWAGGTTAGTYYSNSQTTRNANQGLHLVSGAAATNLPTAGSATYALAGYTKPTHGAGVIAPGTFTGSLGVAFGSQVKVGFDLRPTVDGQTYVIATPGGSATPASSPIILNSNMTFSAAPSGDIALAAGGICPGGCNAYVQGFLAGDGASNAGIAYTFGPTGNGGALDRIYGSAAFSRSGYDPTPAVDPNLQPPVSSGTLSAPLRLPSSSNLVRGVALLAPVATGFISDAVISSAVVTNADGLLTGFTGTGGSSGQWERNNAVTADAAGTRNIQIGRWNGGDILRLGQTALSPDGWEGAVYMVGSELNSSFLPRSVTATYSLVGSTTAFSSGQYAPGALQGTAAIEFASTGLWKMGLSANLTTTEANGQVIYNLSTLGGAADPSQSPIQSSVGYYEITSPAGSSVCTAATCGVNIRNIILAGSEARDVGLSYRVGSNVSNAILGAALFQRNDSPILMRQELGYVGMSLSPGGQVVTNAIGLQNHSNAASTTLTRTAGGDIESIQSNNGFTGIGTAQAAKGTSGGLSWARWSNGAVQTNVNGATATYGANTATHVIVGDPTATMPTIGTATFALAGATAPTIADGSVAPGTFSGSMAVQFGTSAANSRVGFDFDVAIGGHTYDLVTPGGLADLSQSAYQVVNGGFGSYANRSVNLSVAAGGPACPATACRAEVGGFFTGVGVTGAGVSYTIAPFGSPNNETAVQGVAAFIKN